MRYGVVSDVHANLHALRAAVNRLTAIGVDAWLCAGDIVGYGPHPNECVEVLGELSASCVAGNHELMVLGRLDPQRAGRLARETTPWTRSVLRPDSLAYLAGLPTTLRVPGLVLAHGTPGDATTYVREPYQARQELDTMRRTDPSARLLVLGHTHRPWLFGAGAGTVSAPPGHPLPLPVADRFLLNPGSVGQSRQAERVPRVRFALLDLHSRQARFFAEPYDVAGAADALRRHGLPRSCLHVPPGRWWAVPRRTRTVLRAARRAVRG